MKSRLGHLLVLNALAVLFTVSAVSVLVGAEAPPPKRVLMIATGSRLAPGFVTVDREVLQELSKITSPRIETYAENLDLVRFSSRDYQTIFTNYLAAKYAGFPPDLIILSYVGNLGISGKLLSQLFPRTPVVVAGFTEEELKTNEFSSLVTGVAQRVNPRATLELILRTQPDLRRLVIIAGTTQIDKELLERVRYASQSFRGRVRFDFWDNRTMAELRQQVSALAPGTAILFARLFRDAAGQAFVSSEVAQSLAQVASVPLYVMTNGGFGGGAIGGSIGTIEGFAKRAGEMARLILTGTDIESLPLEIRDNTVPMFDWRALNRWNISESQLPPDAVVRFRPESYWQEYRWYILAAAMIILLQGLTIVDLLLQRHRLHQVQAVLREAQELTDLATSAGEVGLWSRDLEAGDIWANLITRSLFGFGPNDPIRFEDMLGRVHPDDRTRLLAEAESTAVAGLPFQGEFRTRLPDGTQRWVLAKGRIVIDPAADASRRMGVMLDITERKRAATELENERAFLRQVIDTTPNFIFAKDREGRFTLANEAVAYAYGTTVENLVGKTDADFNPHAEEVEVFRRADQEVIDTLQERFISEERITDAYGKVRWLQTVKRPIIEPDGTARQLLGASTDITLRKQTEAQLREQRAELAHVGRITMMGELAASLAHELNQPLTAIRSNAQAALHFLDNEPADIEEVIAILRDIIRDDTRASEVIRRMRALVKKEALDFTALDIAALVREVVTLVHSDAIIHNVRVSLDLGTELPPARGDKVQLQQVLLNILLNAFDAMKESAPGERLVRIRLEHHDSFIHVGVADSGPGLSADKLEKIFEPFYTTKGEGLGMGLSICRSIIEAHGGQLTAQNNSRRGASFYFTLPMDGSEATKAKAHEQRLAPEENNHDHLTAKLEKVAYSRGIPGAERRVVSKVKRL